MDLSFNALKKEYEELYATCDILGSRVRVVAETSHKLFSGKPRYEIISGKFPGMPWWFVGMPHLMECGGRFDRHLHNGDSLLRRTVRVPAGRPVEPPWNGASKYSWEQSAIDALKLKNLDQWKDWSIPAMLYLLEKFNGFGYRKYHPHVKTPYLWSFTNHYTRGKYIADGKWSEVAVSEQVGCAALLKALESANMLK